MIQTTFHFMTFDCSERRQKKQMTWLFARLILVLLAVVACCHATSYSPVGSTTVLSFATDATQHLITTLTIHGNFAGSFGVGSSMNGPAVSCYVPTGNSNGAVCTDLNVFQYGVSKVAQVSTIMSATSASGSSTVTVSTPLSRLGLTAGHTSNMIFAYQGWDSSQNIPTQHASNAMAVMSIPIPSPPSAATTTTTSITTTTTTTHAPTTSTPTTTHVPMTTATAAVTSTTVSTAEHTTASVATTTMAPTSTAAAGTTTLTTAASTVVTAEVTTTHMQPTTSPPPPPTITQTPLTSTGYSSTTTTTTTSVAPLPSTTTEPTTLSIFLSVASGDLMIQLSYNSTMLWGMMAIANGYSGTFGVVSSQGMTGSMISCYAGNEGSISPTCFDLDGQDYFVATAPNRYTTFHSASSNGSRAMMYFSALKSSSRKIR